MKLKISIEYLRILYELQCKHKEKYMKPTNPLTWNPADCEDCVLAKMPWRPKLGAMKDLCFLIWHEKILEKKRRKNDVGNALDSWRTKYTSQEELAAFIIHQSEQRVEMMEEKAKQIQNRISIRKRR